MEMGSGSLTDSGSSNPSSPPTNESVNGLKFGKKIYFEDHLGVGSPAESANGSSSSSSGAPTRKAQGGQQQPPRCQVEGCKVDLTDAKAYYSRHKVCGTHSKSPKVIVAGLEQRFCQQCSRFHQLPEFDQGKRSCRRRLAGHNERRRKPPPGSLLSPRFGRISSTSFDNRVGSFLLDFSAYPRPSSRDGWSTGGSSERIHEGQALGRGRSTTHPWQSSPHNPPTNVYLQDSAGGIGFSASGIPSGERFTGVGVTDSSCALSLLSNQPWGSCNRASGLEMNNLVNTKVAPAAQSTAPHVSAVNQYPNSSWGFKVEASSNSHEMCPDLGLGHISQPLSSQFSSELELSQQNRRQYMELEHSRAYDSSTLHMHWSL
ncbi:hypothetical protein K2173_025055 [Erythroxylum novogranatense]|uniref:SBP-type domain-containing protein n=1 Tax=Erythroxylum novogranatense TaxID=1862640 RepID=A0AAV8SWG6_9ROSI|nr:hypothetical protein K2173_025055 [Erythroxylum novogranatense]